MIRQANCIKFFGNLGKIATKTLAVIRQAIGEESMSRTQKVKLTETEKDEIGKDQSQVHVHRFLSYQVDC
jgi:hypothetical protein